MYLEIVRKWSEKGAVLKGAYRLLLKKELYLIAYANLYANEGATTPGVDPADTVDGMSLGRIERLINSLKEGTYRWRPVRRAYVPKKKGKRRPLGLPTWSNKLLQEVIRLILEAYYEPRFSDHSHGYRAGRGCHTALRSIQRTWKGTKWLIKVDIRGAFDNLDHDFLLNIIGRDIKDKRFLDLLRYLFKAGYVEDWTYHRTYSGVPQGGVVSPILLNIYLNELDKFVAEQLIPQYTSGQRRARNPAYRRLTAKISRAKKTRDIAALKQAEQQRRKLPSSDPNDSDYRRLRFCRYADDALLGFTGPKSEAIAIKEKLGAFLQTIGLTMSPEKTQVTHATQEGTRFLSYDIYMAQNDNRLSKRHPDGTIRRKSRAVNGQPILTVPREVANQWQHRYTRHGKTHHRPELLNNSDYDIVMTYNLEFQGLVNYYLMANDVASKLYPVKYYYQQSLAKTLAAKHKQSVNRIFRKHYQAQANGIKAITVTVPRTDKPPLRATFGAKPIRTNSEAVIKDQLPRVYHHQRSELLTRLLADECELCGSSKEIEVHHVRKLKDIQKKYQGRPNPPQWVTRMSALRRKTLVVCRRCHQQIHAGSYDGQKLT